MNLQLDRVEWDLGAYQDATRSGVVVAPPRHLFALCEAGLGAGFNLFPGMSHSVADGAGRYLEVAEYDSSVTGRFLQACRRR